MRYLCLSVLLFLKYNINILFFAKTGSKFLVLAFRGPEIRYAILVPVSILFINFI